MNNIKKVKTASGKEDILVDGFRYYTRKARCTETEISWLCRYSCNVSIKTNLDCTAVTYESNGIHEHPPDESNENCNDSFYESKINLNDDTGTTSHLKTEPLDIEINEDVPDSYNDIKPFSDEGFASSPSKRYEHYNETEDASQEKKIECIKKCGRRFKSNKKMIRHSENCNAGQPVFSCEICEKSFKNSRKLEKHFTKCSSKLSDERGSSPVQTPSTPETNDVKKRKRNSVTIKRKCADCGKSFVALEKHRTKCREALIKYIMENANCLIGKKTHGKKMKQT